MNLLLENTSTNSLAETCSAIRFAASKMDPRRVHLLLSSLLSDPLKGSTSFAQSKRLNFAKSILTELSWRAPQYNGNWYNFKLTFLELLLGILEQNMAHPLKQVRLNVGETLSILFFNLWDPPRNALDQPTLDKPAPKNPKYIEVCSF